MDHPPLPAAAPTLSNLPLLRSVARVGCLDPERAVQQEQVYDWFGHWNEAVFSSQLDPVLVNVSITPYGGSLGLFHPAPVQLIEIHPRCWNGGAAHHETFGTLSMPGAAFVVLHEMIHLAVEQAGLPSRGLGGGSHNSAAWVGWCNFIAELFEIPLTYACYRRTKAAADPETGKRKNIRKPISPPTLRPGTRLATYDETTHFPYLVESPLIQANTSTTKAGEPQLPTF